MPNSAEIIEKLAIQSTCQKILLTINEECKNLDDVKEYIIELLKNSENPNQ